jgi:hypothetical protein
MTLGRESVQLQGVVDVVLRIVPLIAPAPPKVRDAHADPLVFEIDGQAWGKPLTHAGVAHQSSYRARDRAHFSRARSRA